MSGLPSSVVIRYDGTDITANVLSGSQAPSFESQINAQPGQFQLTVKDPTRSLNFTTGKEITLDIDGVRMYGGYLTQAGRGFFFPAVDTNPVSEVDTRNWTLRGVDYNILFDRRVLWDSTSPTSFIADVTVSTPINQIIQTMGTDYLNLPGDLDLTTKVSGFHHWPSEPPGSWEQTGSYWRAQMEDFASLTGAVWYIDPSKRLNYRAIWDSFARWGFSDVPNKKALTAAAGYQQATYGFRELDVTEDGSHIINDAKVWGGSALGSQDVVLGHVSNTDSITKHNRWEIAEPSFGKLGTQSAVDTRASVIVSGKISDADPASGRGLVFPQWKIKLSWFSHDVPLVSGSPDHLKPGDLVPIHLYVLRDADNPSGLFRELPLRQIRISFPVQHETGDSFVRFDGNFGLEQNDPFTLWRYLLGQQKLTSGGTKPVASVANNSSTSTYYGGIGRFVPTPAPNGTTTVFDLPNNFGYIQGTTYVHRNGLFQRDGIDYTETEADLGEITFMQAPATGDELFVDCRTTGTF